MKARLAIGRVRTSFGRAGEIKIESYSGESAHIVALREFTLLRAGRERNYKVEAVRVSGELLIAKLAGIDTPEQAKELRESELVVSRESAANLEDGEVYFADLHGLEVHFAGRRVGAVVEIWEAGGRDLLEVKTSSGSRIVPYEDAFVESVNVEAGVMVLRTDAVLE